MNSALEDLLGAYSKLIMDPVHGGIPIQEHEAKVIDHPLFQRLRFICQNDILSLVFPGATHSRFLHSIGASHVGGRMFKAMVSNQLKDSQHQTQASLNSAQIQALSYFHKILRLACLLHDSGHCSFSHQFSRSQSINTLLKRPGRFAALWRNKPYSDYYSTTPQALEHEHYSVRIALQILQDIHIASFGIEIIDVLGLMETTEAAPSPTFEAHCQAFWDFICPQEKGEPLPCPDNFTSKMQALLARIVSGELDADRADYMLRDSFHSSVTIGGFNLDHLLSNLRFGYCVQTQWFGLAVAQKGLGSLEDFVYSRHQMYRQVYAHKTAQGFDWLLRAAIEEVMHDPAVQAFVDHALDDIGSFKFLTDNYFWEAFRQRIDPNKLTYSQCIIERIKLQHTATHRDLSEEETGHYHAFIAKEHGLAKQQVVASRFVARFSKISGNFNHIKVWLKTNKKDPATLQLISHKSHFFGKFADDIITHFYIDPVQTSPLSEQS